MSETTEISVETESGRVRGSVVDGVHRYLGVPYAAAPFGPNRFRPPQPVVPWSGERDCTEHGATPPQLPYGGGMEKFLGTAHVPGDEILNLAIWAPEGQAGALAPVIVWIHGGSLSRGSNALEVYDGTRFAQDGVLFVGANYRLGAEGFSVLDGAPANLGLADQIEALRWVRRNIWAFGGDPSRVTVMGESAGAITIAALLALPDAASLFDRAIMQSGPPDAKPAKTAGAVTRGMAKLLGVAPSRDAFAALSPARLLDAQRRATAGTTPITGGPAFALTLGSETVPRHPMEALTTGAGSGIPVLFGANTEEYRLWFVPTGLLTKIGWLHIVVAMAKFGISPGTVRLYRRNRPGASVGELFGALATDLLLRVPLNKLADARLAVPGAAPSFVYEFAWRSPVDGLGACHALELGFVFDNVDNAEAVAMAGPDAPRRLATDMHAAWVRFAATGDPGWPAWSAERPVKMWDGTTDAVVPAPREQERARWR
ncbi:carboxylesterase/lipase family protein [Microterricola viridarii]|uniref:Carboxylic ester hydrolase n=1 Tax=Microterricola viridarii TaxID=412690 RepID=A0A0X8E0Y9_9MICO|nr:carboxylesterase family protein [Microterricola viridarii]AMB58306.1 carboxylesterase [Microterricola viridarii]